VRRPLTIEQVAKHLECSDSKISRIETGRVSATPRDVRDMLTIYGVFGQELEILIQLAREARQKGWWHQEYGDLPIAALVSLQDAAASISTYQVLVVPALLQIEAYARAAIRAVRPDLNSEEIERRVNFRMAHQALLAQENAPTLWAVLDEAVLRRPIGGRRIMQEQLERLIEAAAWPNVVLQVLMFSVGEHAGIDGAFTIVGFREPADPDVVHLEHTTSDLYVEDVAAVRQYVFLFDHLRAEALSPDDSIRFLANLATSP
jgi:transcriptional regulator with XRE-family HTH domain